MADRFEQYADLRLTEWARWAKKVADGCGWPPETLLSRVIREGLFGAAHADHAPVTIPEPVAEIDKLISRMPPHIRASVCEHYLTYAPSEYKARRLGISRSVFWTRVKAGQWFTFAALSIAA